jgi:hypothetical protein
MLAAACTGGGATRTSTPPPPDTPSASATTPSPSPSPSPSRTGPLSTGPNVRPGEKPPVLPEAAKEHSPAGALVFAGYYFKALDWSIATNDPYLVAKISDPTCGSCKRYIHGLNELAATSSRQNGGRIRLRSAKLVSGSFRFKSELVVDADVSEDQAVLVRPSQAPSTTSAARYDSLVFVSWRNSGWRIIEEASAS